MKTPNSPELTDASDSTAPQDTGFSPWQRLKSKKISYLTIPLLVMATITEFVILATGWKYQQMVCLPQGMGVTFFHIGPIGATILAVELLKLPLAIWTASRHGWQKIFMIAIGLPMICLLTFQLVKDMAVYEMGVAMKPATEALVKATDEEGKVTALKDELTGIQQKKTDRESKIAEMTANEIKSKADLEDSLKRNDDLRSDAVNLTDYQRKELENTQSRQAALIQQFNADAAQLTKDLSDLRARREQESGKAGVWNAEDARIDNEFKAKMVAYQNAEDQYKKDKSAWDTASVLQHPFMKKPIDPGVPPVRESNKLIKPTLVAELDEQINAKQAELAQVNNKRRDSVAQVDADARHLRAEYDSRSTSKREAADRKRDELLAGQAALTAQFQSQKKQMDDDLSASVQKVGGIQAEIDAHQKQADQYYEEREAAIRNTQVHRIATTVEIVRGLLHGEKPASIKATAKERGDILTDQISMVRISVYPILAFIVAFLPTLMVEIGFSTIFEPEHKRASFRYGFLGRRLHDLYIRAGRIKMIRAERLANEASGEISLREKALADKDSELIAAREANAAAVAAHAAEITRQENEWVAKLSGMADSLNRSIIEKDALRDLQKSEVERQIQSRQNAWSDRITQLTRELDEQRTAFEQERTALMTSQHKKLIEVSEESKAQVVQARRAASDAELNVIETSAKMNRDLKEAIMARDSAEAQLKQQEDTFAVKLSQVKDDAARELEKTARQEKHRLERQQLEFTKSQRQREEEFEHQLKQREQELSLAFDGRIAEEQTRIEQNYRRREADLERQFDVRALDIDARWKQDVQLREEAALTRLKQREQQLLAQTETRFVEVQKQWATEARTRQEESEHQSELRVRAAETRLAQEAQQKDEALQARNRQRETELEAQLNAQAESRLVAARTLWEAEADKRVRAIIEPLKEQLVRAEKERDDARHVSSESARHAQHLEKRLTDASSFLSAWRNGNNPFAPA